jgi:hypothetical protein
MYLIDGRPKGFGKWENHELSDMLVDATANAFVIEKIESFGMAVGAEVFETVFWSGRFAQALGGDFHRIGRKDVKMHLCHSMRATDANIRCALIDKFGGKDAAIGRKANPGPLYGISKDCWSALAVGITWLETMATVTPS